MPTDFNLLCDDVLEIIYHDTKIKCHTCYLKFSFTTSFYKKVGNLYFCSENCFNHI